LAKSSFPTHTSTSSAVARGAPSSALTTSTRKTSDVRPTRGMDTSSRSASSSRAGAWKSSRIVLRGSHTPSRSAIAPIGAPMARKKSVSATSTSLR
jgi:hypothetical protein